MISPLFKMLIFFSKYELEGNEQTKIRNYLINILAEELQEKTTGRTTPAPFSGPNTNTV